MTTQKAMRGGFLTNLFGAPARYWEKFQEIRGLMAYAAAFKPKVIDKNFQTFYEQYPSVSVPRSGPVAAFETDPRGDILPDTYRMEGVDKPFAPMWKAFHWTGLVILKNGKLIHEEYARGNSAQAHHIEMSVTKSLTSIVFGAAYDRGLFPDLNARVIDYIPELKGSAYDRVTIQQVLDMTTGVRFTEDYGDLNSDVVRMIVSFLRGSVDEYTKTTVNLREPGTYRQYATVDTHVLGWLLRKQTGKSFEQLFEDWVWSKIGAEADAKLLVDNAGVPLTFGGANLTLRDLARVGQMMANGGVSMTGERVISEEWVRQSITQDTPQSQADYNNPHTDSPLGYKNQWWFPNDRSGNEFMAKGIYGQFMYVNPQENIVIAMNSAYPDFNEDENFYLDMAYGVQAMAAKVAAKP